MTVAAGRADWFHRRDHASQGAVSVRRRLYAGGRAREFLSTPRRPAPAADVVDVVDVVGIAGSVHGNCVDRAEGADFVPM
ncbi:hypothetical protein [Streptomyces sp. NPDC047315]|uniref:hypothetical protein n=1 Tax=Streptomyces sp. NPDC047315 TaxID=3155142 RepID=UPI0033F0669C